jgi:predicted amidohydrolase YtcJ
METAGIILYNGKIVTVDNDFTIAEAVSIQDGKFQAVGSCEMVMAYGGPGTKMIDLNGKTAIPGVIDSHIKEIMKNGVTVGGGSDAPSNEWHPSILFWFDLTRQSRGAGVLGPGLALSRKESLMYHTIDAARISNDEDKQGSIEPGKLADLVVTSDDILTCSVDRVKEMQVQMTVVGGDIKYHHFD